MIKEYLHFFRRCWPLLVFGFTTVFWGNFGQSFYISWFGASFQESLQLTAVGYGSAYSLATLVSGFLLMWLGGAIDTLPLRWFVVFCGLGLSAATLTLWQVESLNGLIIGLFLLRFFGQGLLPHTAITTMVREFSSHRGKAVSVAATGLPLGEILLPSVAVFLIATFGWQKSWLLVALSVPLIYLPLALWLLGRGSHLRYREKQQWVKPSNAESGKKAQGSRRTLLRDLRFWCALPAILAAPFIVTGVFIHQGFFLPQLGWTPQLFATCFIYYGVGHWLSSIYTGALVDRFSGVRLLKLYPLPMLVGLVAPLLIAGDAAAYIFMIFQGICMGASSPVVSAIWAEVYGTQHVGSIRALVSSLAILSTSASPLLLGYFIDRGISARDLFLWMAVYVLMALLLSLFSYAANSSERREG